MDSVLLPSVCVTASSGPQVNILMYSPNKRIPAFPITASPEDLRPNVERRGKLPLI